MAYSKLGQGFSLVNMIKKVWHFAKPYIIKYYVAFLCGGFSWMLLDVYVTKGIDASFVSAVMDSIMAGTAILAVLAARNYLAQFTAQEGYKLAIHFVNFSFHELLSLSTELKEDSVSLENYYKGLVDKEKTTVDLNGFTIYPDTFKGKLQKINECKTALDKELASIKTYGLHLNPERSFLYEQISGFSKQLNDIFDDFTDLNNCYIDALDRELDLEIRNPFLNLPISRDKFSKTNDTALTSLVTDSLRIKCISKDIYSCCDEFISKSEKITKIFVV